MGERRARRIAAGRQRPLACRSLAVLAVLLLGFCLPALVLLAPAAQAQAPEVGRAALISADSLTYDEGLGIVTARGHVEISQEGRVLVADSISYNVNTDVVTASGNVALVETTGDVFFANYM
jgi:LPS-assembly protein